MISIDARDADTTGGEPLFLSDGTPIGQVSFGAYGYTVGSPSGLNQTSRLSGEMGSMYGRPPLGKEFWCGSDLVGCRHVYGLLNAAVRCRWP